MANLKYRAWDKELQTMLDVSLIDFKKECQLVNIGDLAKQIL